MGVAVGGEVGVGPGVSVTIGVLVMAEVAVGTAWLVTATAGGGKGGGHFPDGVDYSAQIGQGEVDPPGEALLHRRYLVKHDSQYDQSCENHDCLNQC